MRCNLLVQKVSDLLVGLEEQLHIVAEMLIELIHSQSWSGLFGVANNNSDAANPH